MVTKILERHLEPSLLHECLQNISFRRKLSIRLIVALPLMTCGVLSGNSWRRSVSAWQCPAAQVRH